MISRRQFAIATGAGFLSVMLDRRGELHAAEGWPGHLKQDIIRLEAVLNARLGVTVLDTATGQRISHRGSERFPMCSTFKVLAGAAVLKRVDAGQEDLSRRIRFAASEVVTYSPVTKERVGGDGMTLAELCEAAITQSDNTAGNMILKTLGGPSALTTFARSLGDTVTRLDRWETELNEATPGDPRDTTTPDAMTANLHALVVQDRLSPRARDQLAQWLVSNKTGDAKLRAGLPKDWRIGDKTGGGDHGTMNDVAVIWPPERSPLIVSVYITETKTSFDDRNAAIAELGRSIKAALAA
jgi:beta-lactamase class A